MLILESTYGASRQGYTCHLIEYQPFEGITVMIPTFQMRKLGPEKFNNMPKNGVTGDEMVGWHHRLNGHESKQAPGDGGGQGTLACCSPWGQKDFDMTERLNSNQVTK